MKKLLSMIVGILIIISSFSGCKMQEIAVNGKIIVYTSFATLADFVKKIGGEKVTVLNIMSGSSDPHDWEPTPKDIKGLEKADLFVYNGAGIEAWVDGVIDSLDNNGIKTVKTSEAVILLGEIEDEDEGDEHDGHNHGEFDPHTWLSPVNALLEMQSIKNALIEIDSGNEEYYTENYLSVKKQCDMIDGKYKALLAPYKESDVIVAHGAYGYLFNEYGLHQISVKGFSPDSEPTPKKMAEVVEYIRQSGIKYIFFEPNGTKDIPEAISRDTGVTILLLNPIETLNLAGGEDYFSAMESNLAALLTALE